MQGFNMGRYVPPEHAGLASANALHGKHPLGKRARPDGALVVRFEMPFPVWCTTCRPRETLIGQGVRFNAEKRRAGSYHSTPVWAFRMRHPPCGGAIEIRTDPAHTAYVVASGGRRHDAAGDGGAGESLVSASGEVQLRTARERDAARGSAFAHLERTIEDRAALAAGRQRIGELAEAAGRRWDDPYARNQALRRAFRAGRQEREAEGAAAEALRDRLSFGLELVAASDEDARRAALVDFGTAERDAAGAVDKALARPLFEGGAASAADRTDKGAGEVLRSNKRSSTRDGTPKTKKLKSEVVADKTKGALVSEILGNTRAAKDPFLEGWSKESTKSPGLLPGLKRKRSTVETAVATEESSPPPAKPTPASKSLVGYDSDSD
ncbi:uncharacterized protein E0L32_011458 [Thyridium curvatum]|uniref:Coiled-coil domain-containing protein 130 n=1 Tax=Thyridium curvatum TaxID=1093900 RepID=A0A507BH66_9PEZI|nr:uncharacterized protein E0L32_011458 [Thyridium curvatum]TPX18843.1 hypothetical protein E0L32_011458 [Thyridium curvatum]